VQYTQNRSCFSEFNTHSTWIYR